jgi:hypothetical protein
MSVPIELVGERFFLDRACAQDEIRQSGPAIAAATESFITSAGTGEFNRMHPSEQRGDDWLLCSARVSSPLRRN